MGYYGTEELTDKTHKLNINNGQVRENKEYMHLPVQDNDPTSSYLAGSLKCYIEKLAPEQTRIYYRVIPAELRFNDGSYKNIFMRIIH